MHFTQEEIYMNLKKEHRNELPDTDCASSGWASRRARAAGRAGESRAGRRVREPSKSAPAAKGYH
jgi:hypothetical protein